MKEIYGLYAWSPENSEEHIYPPDLKRVIELYPFGKVFAQEASDLKGFTSIRFGDKRVLVKPELFQPLPTPPFKYDQRVFVASKGEEALIKEIHWHFKREEPFYYVEMNGKKYSKRLFEGDLEPV